MRPRARPRRGSPLVDQLRFWALAAALGAFACPPFAAQQPNVPPRDRPETSDEDLPETAEQCIRLAERLGKEYASRAELRLALKALERAETLSGGSVDLWIKQAKIIFYIAEPISKEARVIRWLNRGQQLAKRIKRFAPDRVEGYYYYAAFLGFRAQIQEVGGLDLLPEIVEAGRRAVEIDPEFDDAAPLMMMGMVLVQAPAWPQGIGDPDEGIELLQRGVEVSDYPLNRLILAKAYLIDGQKTLGCQQLAKVLAAPKRGRWAKTGQRYRQEARVLASTSRCSEIGRDP